MRARNIKRGGSTLTPSDLKENESSIKQFSSELTPILCAEEPAKANAMNLFISSFLTKLANKERLHFANALENYAAFFKLTSYNSSLPDIFKEILKRKSIEDIQALIKKLDKEPNYLAILDASDKTKVENALKRFQKQDAETDAFLAKPTSVIGILDNQGYLASNEPFFDKDLELALEGYQGTHGPVSVICHINASNYQDRQQILKPLLDEASALAKTSGKPHDLLMITNNGTHHFVFVKMTVDPSGEFNITLTDSKPEDKVSSKHKSHNDEIVEGIEALVSPESVSTVVYTGEQGENANCPFYSMRQVINICSRLPEFEIKENNDLSQAAKSNDIVRLQLAATQKLARKKGLSEEKVSALVVDELGILHTEPQTEQYKSHRAFRIKSEGIDEQQLLKSERIEEQKHPANDAEFTATFHMPKDSDEALLAEIEEAEMRERIRAEVLAMEELATQAEVREAEAAANAALHAEEREKTIAEVKAMMEAADRNEVQEAEAAANRVEVLEAEAAANAALAQEQESKKTPREKIVDGLCQAITDLTINAQKNSAMSSKEKRIIALLTRELNNTLPLIVSTDLTIDQYKAHFLKIKTIITRIHEVDPNSWKATANKIGKLTVLPALITKGLTGRWGVFKSKEKPGAELNKFMQAVEQLEQEVMASKGLKPGKS